MRTDTILPYTPLFRSAAICEAVNRPSMRFVPVKDEHQQATLCLHRTRQGFIEERTATYNRLRGLLSEFGVVLPQSPERLRREIGPYLDRSEEHTSELQSLMRNSYAVFCLKKNQH